MPKHPVCLKFLMQCSLNLMFFIILKYSKIEFTRRLSLLVVQTKTFEDVH